uniref:HECT domain-containing protein n=1 Tax=Steinernema glaseri TaxID=37863 RepID=A0A1I7XYV7_9BILA
MDTVPHVFVISLMETLRVPTPGSNRECDLHNMQELGRGYGMIAEEMYDKTRTCSLVIPGLFCETLSDVVEDDVFAKAPVFRNLTGWHRRSTNAKNLVKLSVTAENLVFNGNGATTGGVSLRELRRLMASYKDVVVRELIVKGFPSAPIPQRSLFSEFTTNFNRVKLYKCIETDAFRDFLLALVADKKLQTLELLHGVLGSRFAIPPGFPRLFNSSTVPIVTPWLQKALLEVFFQPQFLKEFSFDFDWDSNVFCDVFLRNWLQEPEAFPVTTKCLKVFGTPSVELLKRYGFKSIDKTQWIVNSPVREGRRRFVLPHPRSVECTLELASFVWMLPSEAKITNKKFCKRASYFEIRFHCGTGDLGRQRKPFSKAAFWKSCNVM